MSLTLQTTLATRSRSVPPWARRVIGGLARGVVLGWAARAFMRLVAEEPEFTWSGTLFIVGLFTVFGLVQGIVDAGRAASTTRWVTGPLRLLGGLFYLPLGMGAGTLMAPFLWCGALAWWHPGWRRWLRAVLGGIAVLNLGAVVTFSVVSGGGAVPSAAGVIVLSAVYLGVIHTAGATFRPPADHP
jgi:hypothetical protein